jgi:cell wall-associated NlpC family hydrolase
MIRLDDYIGIPYVKRGRSLAGWDCWGVVFVLYPLHLGIGLGAYGMLSGDDYRAVAREIEAERQAGSWHPCAGDRDFDLALMTSPTQCADGLVRERAVHVGLVFGKGVLHCEEDIDTVLVDKTDPSISRRITGYYRHRSLIQ